MSLSIGIESFSAERADAQGRELYELVNAEKNWLFEAFPGTVERYQELPAAINNVARVAAAEGLHAYLAYYDKQAIGVGTIIVDAVVEHPEEGIFWGSDIDYWTVFDSGEQGSTNRFMHNQIAAKLMFANEVIQHERKDKHPPHPLPDHPLAHEGYDINPSMGTIRVDTPKPSISIGLGYIMEPVGAPAQLTVPGGQDPFGLTKDGAEVQLYTHNITPIK